MLTSTGALDRQLSIRGEKRIGCTYTAGPRSSPMQNLMQRKYRGRTHVILWCLAFFCVLFGALLLSGRAHGRDDDGQGQDEQGNPAQDDQGRDNRRDVDWPSYNRTLTSERFVPRLDINRFNVQSLRTICTFEDRKSVV